MEFLQALTVMAMFVIGNEKFCVMERWHMSDGIEYDWYSCLYPDWPTCWARTVEKMEAHPTGTEGLDENDPGPTSRAWGCELNPETFNQLYRET